MYLSVQYLPSVSTERAERPMRRGFDALQTAEHRLFWGWWKLLGERWMKVRISGYANIGTEGSRFQ